MRVLFLLFICLTVIFISCTRDIHGAYNSNYSSDKSAFLEIRLYADQTVEKTEIHTIGLFAKGKFEVTGNTIVCYFDSSRNKFPPDTLRCRVKGKKLYFIKNGVLNRKFYLLKSS